MSVKDKVLIKEVINTTLSTVLTYYLDDNILKGGVSNEILFDDIKCFREELLEKYGIESWVGSYREV